MDTIALYDLNPQQKYTEYLLTNYSEKKQFYVLDAQERKHLQILQNEYQMKKNPTWLGIMMQNAFNLLGKVTEIPYFETISNFFGKSSLDIEMPGQQDVKVEILGKTPIIGMDIIKEPSKETIIDVSKFSHVTVKE